MICAAVQVGVHDVSVIGLVGQQSDSTSYRLEIFVLLNVYMEYIICGRAAVPSTC